MSGDNAVTTTWLQMFAVPDRPVPAPRGGLIVLHAQNPSVGYYRYLYDAVGRDYDWTSRRKLSDEQLTAIISDPRDELYVLHVDGVPAGIAELDCRTEGEIELVQFGLTGPFIGKGLGRWFLRWTIEHAFRRQPKRFWLHTCTRDHTAALPNYVKSGFAIYREETRDEGPRAWD